MDIETSCPRCGQHIVVDSEGIGREVPCPKCSEPFTITDRHPPVSHGDPPPLALPPKPELPDPQHETAEAPTPGIRAFQAHTGSPLFRYVNTVCFHPSGRWLLSGGSDGIVRISDAASGDCAMALKMPEADAFVTCVAVSPNGRQVLTATLGLSFHLWDFESGKRIRDFVGHQGSNMSVCFSQDGRVALSGNSDYKLKLWDVASGRCIRTFEGHTAQVTSVALSPDAQTAFSGSHDGTVRHWDVESGRCVRVIQASTHRIFALSISPAGDLVASSGDENRVRLWRSADGKLVKEFTSVYGTMSLSFSPKGRLLAVASRERAAYILDLDNGGRIDPFEEVPTNALSICFSPDGRHVAFGAGDGVVRFGELPREAPAPTTTQEPKRVACRLCGTSVLASTAAQTGGLCKPCEKKGKSGCATSVVFLAALGIALLALIWRS